MCRAKLRRVTNSIEWRWRKNRNYRDRKNEEINFSADRFCNLFDNSFAPIRLLIGSPSWATPFQISSRPNMHSPVRSIGEEVGATS